MRQRLHFLVLGAFLTTALIGTPASAATQRAKVDAPAAEDDARFGWAIDISGNTAVVGAPYEDTPNDVDEGAAYIYIRSGSSWLYQARVAAPGGSDLDFFGYSVGISGDTVIVGAPGDDDLPLYDRGAVYVFVRSGSSWLFQDKIEGFTADDRFGRSVAVSGDLAVVGAPGYDRGFDTDAGAAYTLVRSGSAWSKDGPFLASDFETDDAFGWSVDLDDDTFVVGALGADHGTAVDAGAAYVFVRAGSLWLQQAKLAASDAGYFEGLGLDVAISGDTVVAGAPHQSHSGKDQAGSAYVFRRVGTSWTQQAKLIAAAAGDYDFFGWSVAIAGDTLVASAPGDDYGLSGVGSVTPFTRSGSAWTRQPKLVATDASAADGAGYGLAIRGDTVLVGVPYDDAAGNTNSGSMYSWEYVGCTSTEETALRLVDNVNVTVARELADELCTMH